MYLFVMMSIGACSDKAEDMQITSSDTGNTVLSESTPADSTSEPAGESESSPTSDPSTDSDTAEAEEDLTTREGWVLIWQDEFTASTIDTSKWEFEVNGQGGGNNELQYYTDRAENVFIEDNALVIEAREESYTGEDGTRDYTSARLRTINQGDWTYGRMEARIKLPQGQGIWPAFWMLPTDWVYGGWAASHRPDVALGASASIPLVGRKWRRTTRVCKWYVLTPVPYKVGYVCMGSVAF